MNKHTYIQQHRQIHKKERRRRDQNLHSSYYITNVNTKTINEEAVKKAEDEIQTRTQLHYSIQERPFTRSSDIESKAETNKEIEKRGKENAETTKGYKK
ncbi:hypothetical protein LINPERHAP1_LOCUS616, partial [Linum perenne]